MWQKQRGWLATVQWSREEQSRARAFDKKEKETNIQKKSEEKTKKNEIKKLGKAWKNRRFYLVLMKQIAGPQEFQNNGPIPVMDSSAQFVYNCSTAPTAGKFFENLSTHILGLKRSDATKNFVFGSLRTVLQRALEWDLLDRNPASAIKPPRKGLPRTEYWSVDEVKTFLFHMKTSPILPLYMIALNSGMRIGEIFGLKWDCVDLEKRVLTVRRTWDQKTGFVKETTKTHKARVLPLSQPLFETLVELRRLNHEEFVLAPGLIDLGCPSHVARSFKEDSILANVRPIKFHDLRHTFAQTSWRMVVRSTP